MGGLGLLACVWLPAVLAGAEVSFPPPSVPAGWSQLQTGDAPGWHWIDGRLRCLIAAGEEQSYETLHQPILPPGDWTIDAFWLVDADSAPEVSLILRPMAQGPLGLNFTLDGSKLEIRRDHKLEYLPLGAERAREALSGPHVWLRIACAGIGQRLRVWANGCAIPLEDDQAKLVMGRVGMKVRTRGRRLDPAVVELRHLTLSRGLPASPESQPGPAHDGLGQPATPPDGLTPAVVAELERAAGDESAGWTGRTYAALARQLAAWALAEPPGGPAWQGLDSLLNPIPERAHDRLEGLTTAIPLALGTARDGERQQAAAWSASLLSGLSQWHHYPARPDKILVRRLALLNPLVAAEKGQETTTAPDIVEQILATADAGNGPAMLGMVCRQAHDGGPTAWAWLLPELLKLEPRFADLVAARIDAADQREYFVHGQADQGYSHAAWRLAPQAPELAWSWARRVAATAERSDALRLVLDRLPAPTPAQFDEVEAALRQVIAAWQPHKYHPSPVEYWVDLCRWQFTHERAAAGQVSFDTAAGLMAAKPLDRFRDTMRLYHLCKDVRPDQAPAWFQKLIETVDAAEADDPTDESDYGPAEFYVSSASQLITELIRLDRLDEALARLRRLDPVRRVLTQGSGYAFLIERELPNDVELALRLMTEIPDVRGYRSRLRLKVAIAAFENHREQARALIDEYPEEQRTQAWFRVLAANRGMAEERVRLLFADAVRADIALLTTADSRWLYRKDALRMVNQLPIEQVIALREAYAADPEIYARQLLHTTAAAVGLADHPLWRQVREEAWVSEGHSWGAGRLRYTVQNLENSR